MRAVRRFLCILLAAAFCFSTSCGNAHTDERFAEFDPQSLASDRASIAESGYPQSNSPLGDTSILENSVSPTQKSEATLRRTSLTAMSFNIYYKDEYLRSEQIIRLIMNYMPDTIGLQEATQAWINLLSSALGNTYSYVGESRDGISGGEYNPIFYNNQLFSLIESDTLWLSDTPHTPSKYKDSSLNRIMTYAVLERKYDNKRMVVVNTHLAERTAEAREKQVAKLLELLQEYSDFPIVLAGDFNAKPNSNIYSATVSGFLADSAKAAKLALEYATFDNGSVIDYIFVSKDFIEVDMYWVINDKAAGSYPSDHRPIMISYDIK